MGYFHVRYERLVRRGVGSRSRPHLKATTILGNEIGLYRKLDGKPAALENACPHRKLPLSMGRIKGDAVAQSNLGFMYSNGEGVAENDAEAVKWFRKAADQGLAEAQNNLGLMYAKGEGVPENDVQAYKWWNLAAAQGNESAKENKAIVEKKMTREQIAEAQRLSTGWKPVGERD